jgi:hypothetical protein
MVMKWPEIPMKYPNENLRNGNERAMAPNEIS